MHGLQAKGFSENAYRDPADIVAGNDSRWLLPLIRKLQFPIQLRQDVLHRRLPEADEFSTKVRVRCGLDLCPHSSTTPLHHRSGGLRGDVLDTMGR